MNKTYQFLILVTVMLFGASAYGDDLAKEHEKAVEGGYEDKLKDSINEFGGTRLKEEEQKYQEKQESDKQTPQDKPEDYGKSYQEQQLGTEGKVRTW